MAGKVVLTIEVDADLVEMLGDIAMAEGRPIDTLIEEALCALVEKRTARSPQNDAMAIHRSSHGRYASLYRRLAD